MTLINVNHTCFRIVCKLTACWGLFLVLAVPVRAEPPPVLSFAIMLSTFDNGRLTQVPTGELVVAVNGTIWNSYTVSPGGLLDFSIPTDSNARWTLTLPGLTERQFQSEVVDGLLRIANLDRENRSVNYYENDNGAYALEYFQDRLYICNQGQPGGPILGKLKRGDDIGPLVGRRTSGRFPSYLVKNADIVLGDSMADWAGIEPAVRDRTGDNDQPQYGDGLDIRNYCLAKDNQYLYSLITLADGAPRTDIVVLYSTIIGNDEDYIAETTDIFAHASYNQFFGWQSCHGQFSEDLSGFSFCENSAGAGSNFVEFRTPLSAYTSLSSLYASAQINILPDGVGLVHPPMSDVTDMVKLVFTGQGAPTSPGGPEDDFGGIPDPTTVVAGVVDNVQDLPAGDIISGEFEDARTAGQTYVDNRVIPLSEGSDMVSSANRLDGVRAGGVPGVVFQWVYAGDRAPDELFLPLGESGTLADGVTVQTLFDQTAEVPLMVLLRSFPPEFLISLSPGVHRLKYWLQDSEGTKSNERSEEVNIG